VVIFPLIGQQSTDTLLTKDIDQVVITAQFIPTDTRETVNSVKVLNRKTIEQKAAVNLQELLQTEANIRISQDAILGSVISVNALKGENLKILIDGVPIVGRLNGNIDAGQIPLNSIQKIEIIEGAQSLLYGSEASGGVINIITKKSQLTTIDTELSAQYENNGFRNLSARIGLSKNKWIGQISGNFQQFVPTTDTTMGRDQLWNPKQQKSARGMLRYTHSENTDIRLSANKLTESVDNLGDKKRPFFKPYAFDDYYDTDRFDVNLHTEHWTPSRKLLQATLGWNTFQRIKRSYRYDFDNDINDLLPGLQDTSSSKGFLARFTMASDSKKKKWNYILGLENYYEHGTGTRLMDSTATNSGEAYTNDLGIFGSGKINVSNVLTLQSGARFTYNMRYGTAVTPSTWLLWQPKLPFQLKTSWAYGFRSPAIKELFFSFIDVNHYVIGNPNLKPERSVNLRSELTWKTIKMDKTQVTLTATGFYNIVNDRIILTALGPVHYEYRNVDSWKSKGLGFRANVNYRDWLTFQSDVITTGFFNPNDGVNVTEKTYLFSTDWANDLTINLFKDKLTWNIWHKLTGKTPFFYNQDGSTLQGYTDSWNMLNTGLSTYLLNKKIRLNAGVKNIFDIRQLQANNNNGIHIEASNQQNLHWGRNFYVGATYQWN
jgi:outer membrane receptor for ferrienterochelin and colicins